MAERKQKMTNNNHPERDPFDDMLARYSLNGSKQGQPPAENQPTTRHDTQNRQDDADHDLMEDQKSQGLWDRGKPFILPAVLLLGILLSVVTRMS